MLHFSLSNVGFFYILTCMLNSKRNVLWIQDIRIQKTGHCIKWWLLFWRSDFSWKCSKLFYFIVTVLLCLNLGTDICKGSYGLMEVRKAFGYAYSVLKQGLLTRLDQENYIDRLESHLFLYWCVRVVCIPKQGIHVTCIETTVRDLFYLCEYFVRKIQFLKLNWWRKRIAHRE